MKPSYLLFLLSLFLNLSAIGRVSLVTYTFTGPCQPVATITPVDSSYGCFLCSAANSGVPDPYGYTWDFGDGTVITGDTVLHCYPPGTVTAVYTITVTSNSPQLCGPTPKSQSYTLTVNPPSSTLCVRSAPNYTLAATSVRIEEGLAIPQMMYSYNYGDGSSTPGSAPSHTYAGCGNYIITVREWNVNSPQTVCYAYIPVNISCSTATGIFENSLISAPVALFPNPSSATVNLSSQIPINGIKVTDLTGRELLSMQGLNVSSYTLTVSEWPTGTYFLKLLYNNGAEKNLKVIKL